MKYLVLVTLVFIASLSYSQANHDLTYTGTNLDATLDAVAGKMVKATEREIFTSGLIDSVKTSDTLAIKRIYPARTLSRIIYDVARSGVVTVRLELVDSLYQQSGTLVDSCTVTNQYRMKTSVVSGGTFTLTAGKLLRAVFSYVGVMPKHILISGSGTE